MITMLTDVPVSFLEVDIRAGGLGRWEINRKR
jgi:hypothetical protein